MPYANPEQDRACKRRWYLENRALTVERAKKWADSNPEKRSLSKKKWEKKSPVWRRNYRLTHRREHQEYQKAWSLLRRRVNPGFRMRTNLAHRLWGALKGIRKSAKTVALLGCSIPELRAHLETKFRPGMSWENYGPVWHIDHIRPCASFDLTEAEQQRECFNFKNLQPLFAEENLRKGAKHASNL